MEKQSFLEVAEHYLKLTQGLNQVLSQDEGSVSTGLVLDCLIRRDQIAYRLAKEGPPNPQAARLIERGDRHLRAVAEALGKIKTLPVWRQSFHPLAEAWWWHFQPPEPPPDFFSRFDWLWRALAMIFLTLALSLVADIMPRFLSGGPDALGAFAVLGQSILTLLTGRTILTSTSKEAAERFLRSSRIIPRRLWDEAGFVAALLFFIAMLVFRLSLPRIAQYYNDQGTEAFQAGQVTGAQQDYERAIKLSPDLLTAHYNLGLLYEDLNDTEQAEVEYQIAAQGNLDVAYNKLARLYILAQEYEQAAPLLLQGEKVAQQPEVRYDLKKNLGWARLEQMRYSEAETALNEAIDINAQKAPAYCLLAQVLEAQQKPAEAVSQAWERCLQYADGQRPDEDSWIGMARQYFAGQASLSGGE